jgi:hypothetical protein
MYNFLIAAYSLRIKKIEDDIKESIPKKLQGSLLQNRKKITKMLGSITQKAYHEGIKYALVFPGYEDTKVKNKDMSDKVKREIFTNFFVNVKNAERIYKLRILNWKRLLKLNNQRIDLKNGSQESQFKNEYINAVKVAVNRLIMDAAMEGKLEVWQPKRK